MTTKTRRQPATRRKVLRPGITAICRQAGRSRFHVTEVLRGNRTPSAALLAIIHSHGLQVTSPHTQSDLPHLNVRVAKLEALIRNGV